MTTSGSRSKDGEGNGSANNSGLYTPQINRRPASHNNNMTGISLGTFRIVLTSSLQKISNLEHISISGCHVGSVNLEIVGAIEGLHKLEELRLNGCNIGWAGWEALSSN